jgi:small subunit ribosomal protein S16
MERASPVLCRIQLFHRSYKESMLKIRLRRIGAIRQPHYRIVVADARSPRDGRFLEILGHYNPRTEPSTIQVDVAKYEEWKRKGAQPTDAVASLVKQFNKRTAVTEAPAAPDRRTRTASGKRVSAPAPASEEPVAAEAAAEAEVAEEAEAIEEMPVVEASAEEAAETTETTEAPAATEPDTDTAS